MKPYAGANPAPKRDTEGEQVHARFMRADRLKMPWLDLFEECYEYAMPGKERMFSAEPGARRTNKIYDETAVVGVQEFASRLQSGIMPNWSRWSQFVAGNDVDIAQRPEVDARLDEVTEEVFAILASSNLSSELSEAFLDLAVGTGALHVDDGDDPLHPVRFSAIPLARLFIDVGRDDSVDFIATKRKVPVKRIRDYYPRAMLTPDQAKEYDDPQSTKECELIEATYRIWGESEETWRFVLLDAGSKDVLYREDYRGLGSNKFIVFRWSKVSGEVWGRGPLQNALPAVRTCNLTVQMILENAEMSIAGMYTVEDDGVVNVDSIEILPGTVIPIAPGSSMKAVGGAGNFDVAQLILSDMRSNIKRALYNDMLGNPDKTPLSATEVSARMADLSRQIGSAFGRLQYELVEPLLRRVIHILKRQGRITLPDLNGRVVKVQMRSPLSRAQAYEDVQTVTQYIATVGQLFGPQMVNILVKSEEAAAEIAANLQVSPKLLRSAAERQQLMQMAQSALQQMSPSPDGASGGQAPTAGIAGA